MIVCLDSGNSRIKWGVHNGRTWLAQGAVAQAEVVQLAALTRAWPYPAKVLLANVAGAEAARQIRNQLAAWQSVFHEVKAEAKRGGVTNRYENPAQLGVDRWCALIGARAQTSSPCVVVMAGTATTIDTLDAPGNFQGGLILPGLELMHRALARDTAGLPFAAGHYSLLPRCTDDAIVSGAIEAQTGAIERAFARLAVADGRCLLSGGNAALLAAHLNIPCQVFENLPLEGMRQLAVEG